MTPSAPTEEMTVSERVSDERLRERAAHWEALERNEAVSPLRAEYAQRAMVCRELLAARERIAALEDEAASLRADLDEYETTDDDLGGVW